MRVIIIGAGLGGLCLAHGLVRAGIDTAVYERNNKTGAQPASYGIHLNADGLRALHSALPTANWEQLTKTTVPARNVINFHDPRKGLLTALNFQTPEHATDPITRRRAVTRGNLRDALLTGLESNDATGIIHWDRQFDRYETLDDGTVRVYFADGSTATADLLVGADGSNSRVRAQRLPQLQRQDLNILNVAGRITLTPELQATLPTELCDTSINNVVPAGAGWMFISTWATGDSGSDQLIGAENADRYIIWAWAAHRDTYPQHDDNLNGATLKAHVQQRIGNWSPALRHLIAVTDPADIGPVPLRTMPPLPAWEPSAVTLLGDAIHNMTPMGGIGANTALRDAQTLTAALTVHRNSAATTAVARYEAQMRLYANAALALSTRNAERATSRSALARSIFRTLLRLSAKSPRGQATHFPHPYQHCRRPGMKWCSSGRRGLPTDDGAQQFVELIHLLRGQRRRGARRSRHSDCARAFVDTSAFVGHGDGPQPTVTGHRFTGGQPQPLQVVDDANDRRLVGLGTCDQFLLRQRSIRSQTHQNDQMSPLDAQRLQGDIHRPEHLVMRLPEQQTKRERRFGFLPQHCRKRCHLLVFHTLRLSQLTFTYNHLAQYCLQIASTRRTSVGSCNARISPQPLRRSVICHVAPHHQCLHRAATGRSACAVLPVGAQRRLRPPSDPGLRQLNTEPLG